MLYLPLDKIISQTAAESQRVASDAAANAGASSNATPANTAASAAPKDGKDTGLRTRDLRDMR
jgi:hypothetical protein